MHSKFLFAIIFLLGMISIESQGASKYWEGRLVDWIPSNELQTPTTAAFGRSILTVVLFNPIQSDKMDPDLFRFLVLRQDAAAYLASEILRSNGQLSQPYGSPTLPGNEGSSGKTYSQISEKAVYSHRKLGGFGEKGLDCVAYYALDAFERRNIRIHLQGTANIASREFVVHPTIRKMTLQDFKRLESDQCLSVFSNFE